MKTYVSTVFKEHAASARAEIYRNDAGQYYFIEYYDHAGSKFHTETFPGKALNYVEDAADNWAKGIKVLLG